MAKFDEKPPDPMDALRPILPKYEWVTGLDKSPRMRFRADGTGYYERDRDAGTRPIHENHMWKIRDGLLLLKFSTHRIWGEVEFQLIDGDGKPGDRLGVKQLVMSNDPYSLIIEENETGKVVLLSDTGGALPG